MMYYKYLVRETTGNLWDYLKVGAVIAVTTNGVVNRDGANIMGKGCAREARDRCPGVAYRIGYLIKQYGVRCFNLPMDTIIGQAPGGRWTLVSVPTKHHWREDSDPELILQSAEQLVEMADKFGFTEIICPRFGAGLGRIPWESTKELLSQILDDRFLVVHRE